MIARKVKEREMDYEGHKETLENDGHIYYLDCGDCFTLIIYVSKLTCMSCKFVRIHMYVIYVCQKK